MYHKIIKFSITYRPAYSTISNTTNFTLVQTEAFSEENWEFDENTQKFSNRVEITVGKGEIARYERFLLFPQYADM